MLFIRRLRASACGLRTARGGTCKQRSDSDRVRAEHEVGDDTDRWSPPSGERGRERREAGPATGFGPCGKKKKEKRGEEDLGRAVKSGEKGKGKEGKTGLG